jgi:hypothetical protein
MDITLLLMTLLIVKHFIFDFLYQPPYQFMNKGIYGHPGGIIHAGQHAISSLVILSFFIPVAGAIFISLFEFIIHYHMDWFKMWYNKLKGWKADTHNQFWILLGIDQLVHYMTYVLMVLLAF